MSHQIPEHIREKINSYLYRLSAAMEKIVEHLVVSFICREKVLAFNIKVHAKIPDKLFLAFSEVLGERSFKEYYLQLLHDRLIIYMDELTNFYPWIFDWYQTGRNGGWLHIIPDNIEQLMALEEEIFGLKFEDFPDDILMNRLTFVYPDLKYMDYREQLKFLEREVLKIESLAADISNIERYIDKIITELESTKFWELQLKNLQNNLTRKA